ncbi:MAG: DUF4055 domain-containing protein [Lentisphaerae bacterium]|nr:DUF4055 domain-containing protein [Lentisphaerota bacterium]
MIEHSMTTGRYQCVNPQYSFAAEDWVLCDDCFAGEREIKRRGEVYLPRTEGQMADPKYGSKRYEAYKYRANFFNYFASTINAVLGILHREPPQRLELPPRLHVMQRNFSASGDSLEEMLHLVNFHQLVYGRCGMLLDAPFWDDSPNAVPVAALYPAHRILDWEQNGNVLSFVLLDESGDQFNPELKCREHVQRLRLCALDRNGEYYSIQLTPQEYSRFDFSAEMPDSVYPEIRGKRLGKVPFIFVNTSDTTPMIQAPPLLPLANICLAIYRGEADYRHALYMQAQSTLFLKGFPLDDPPMMGAGNYIHTESPDAAGSFLEISGAGLSEMRESLAELHKTAVSMGMSLAENGDSESGEALKTRLSVKLALLENLANTSGAAFRKILRLAAEWCSVDPDTVLFEPNLDFTESSVSASDVSYLWNAKKEGLPLSERSIHEWLRKNDYTGLSYEEELEEEKQGN